MRTPADGRTTTMMNMRYDIHPHSRSLHMCKRERRLVSAAAAAAAQDVAVAESAAVRSIPEVGLLAGVWTRPTTNLLFRSTCRETWRRAREGGEAGVAGVFTIHMWCALRGTGDTREREGQVIQNDP